MPKTDMDYSNTIIYKFVCNDLNIKDCYVGHTTNFIKRKASHKKGCNNSTDKCHNFKVYSFMRENGGRDNWSMIEIEKYPCNDRNEACTRERYWYEMLKANLNMQYPSRTQKEYIRDNKENIKAYYNEWVENNKEKIKQRFHEWHETNKEGLIIKQKLYYETNKQKIMERLTKKIKCLCGCEIMHCNKLRHEKTPKHISIMKRLGI